MPVPRWQDLRQDLRFALRSLRRAPGFALGATLTLALGLGVNTAMFAVMDALLFRAPPAVAAPERLVRLYVGRTDETGRIPQSQVRLASYPEYIELRRVLGPTAQVAAYEIQSVGAAYHREVRPAEVALVSANYFAVLGAAPALGRAFAPGEDATPGASAAAVLAHSVWQRDFDGRRDVLGRIIHLNGHPFTVVGVAPEAFRGVDARAPEVWVPVTMAAEVAVSRNFFDEPRFAILSLIARPAPGRTQADVAAVVRRLGSRLDELFPPPAGSRVLEVDAITAPREWPAPAPGLRSILRRLAVTGAVLLIACLNVANLLLVRAKRREREIAIRLSVGASRGRLIRQLLTESALLVIAGGALAALATSWTAGLLAPLLSLSPVSVSLDWRVFGFTLLAAAVTTLACGLVPALKAARTDVTMALAGGSPAAGSTGRRLPAGLVASQLALSVVLLVFAGVFLRSLRNALATDLGFEPRNVLVATVELAPRGEAGGRARLAPGGEARARAFYEGALERLRAIPGVHSVALGRSLPMGSSSSGPLVIPGREAGPSAPTPVAFDEVGAGYFGALGMAVRRGRGFDERDRVGSAPVAVINEAMARRFWPSEDPIGRCVQLMTRPSPPCMEIVGVVADAKQWRLGEQAEPLLYRPVAQHRYDQTMYVFVRAHGAPGRLASAVQREIGAMHVRPAMVRLAPMQELVWREARAWRQPATLYGLMGVLALLLAAVGLYAVMAYTVSQRTREIGVRMALGAPRNRVVTMILGDGLRIVAAGLAVGLLLAGALSRSLAARLHEVTPHDPVTFGGVALVLAAVALAACFVPAYRASHVDPLQALRIE